MDESFQISEEDWAEVDKRLKPCFLILDAHYSKRGQLLKCTNCGGEIIEEKGYYIHGERVNCPKCGRAAEVINPKLYVHKIMKIIPLDDITVVGSFKVESHDIVWLEFKKVTYQLEKTGDSTAKLIWFVGEEALYKFTPTGATKYTVQWDYAAQKLIYIPTKRVSGYTAYVGSFFGARPASNFFIGTESLSKTFLKYCDFEKLVNAKSERTITELLIRACKYPAWTELLIKLNCIEAATDAMKFTHGIRRNAKTVREIFPALSKEKLGALIRLLKNWKNVRAAEIAEAYEFLKTHNAHALDEVSESEYFKAGKGAVLEIMNTTGITLIKLENYLKKQKYAEAFLYRDYIRECQKLGYPLTDSAVLFPKNLREKHAETSALCRYSISAAQQEKCIKRHERLVKQGLEVETGTLCVRVPYDGKDIIVEGAKQSHCVGGYASRHANGSTTILFIRKKSDPETPYFTAEIDVKSGEVKQCYG